MKPGARATAFGDPATGQIMTEAQVESRVRMLFRTDIAHEAIVTIARDELRRRREERDAALDLLEKCRAALPDAWVAVKCKVPPELLAELNAMLKKHGRD